MDFAIHETLELSEITTFKTLCLTKSKTMKALVSDKKLKEIMQLDIDMTTRQLEAYNTYLTQMNQQATSGRLQ